MSKHYSHISSAAKIINTYNGAQPLVNHLKIFFSTEKKYGSRDRKNISALCYAFFRTGYAMRGKEISDKILTGLFLTEHSSNDCLQVLRPEWNDRIHLSFAEKMIIAGIIDTDIFPFLNEVTEKIDRSNFALSFLQQPKLFLRARPGKHGVVLQKLNDAGILFQTIGENCLSLPHATKATDILKINNEVVIQDLNSQQVLDYLDTIPHNKMEKKTLAWDCCAASGGKSILLYDKLNGNVRLTVSDIRQNILKKLEIRLDEAGININKSFVTDLGAAPVPDGEFDILICDAPCSGSGTWSRTPEQLYYFQKKKINEYALLQKNIISNTIPALKKGGLFFYITCSVFTNENEQQVQYIQEKCGLQLLQMQYLDGYDQFADTMFVSVFKK